MGHLQLPWLDVVRSGGIYAFPLEVLGRSDWSPSVQMAGDRTTPDNHFTLGIGDGDRVFPDSQNWKRRVARRTPL